MQPNSFIQQFRFWTILCSLSIALCSCHRPSEKMQHIPLMYAKGDVQEAKSLAVNLVEISKSDTNIESQRSSAWYLLCAGLSCHAAGDFEPAIRYYDKSLYAIDYYLQESALENVQTLLLDDRQSAYSGDTFEQLLARVYFSLALQQAGKRYDSAALLRQHEQTLELTQERLREISFLKHIQIKPDPVAKYLLACHLEQQSDLSNALILFKQAHKLTKASFIEADIDQIGKRQNRAWLIIVIHRGLLPEKINSYSVGAIASITALEAFLQSRHIDPAWPSLSGLAIPAYRDYEHGKGPELKVRVDGQTINHHEFFDVANAARTELNQRLPVIAARALARQLLRQCFVKITKDKNNSCSAGVTSDFLLLLANVNTRADTRSWNLLPSSITCARLDLEPGVHTIDFSGSVSNSKSNLQSKQIELHKGLNLVEIYAPDASWFVIGPSLKPLDIPFNP